jgi:hypothetical protein
MYNVLIHIGLPKTATSSLQKNIFYHYHEKGLVNYLGRYTSSSHKTNHDNFGSIFAQIKDKKLTDKEVQACTIDIEKHLQKNKLNIISEEAISSGYRNNIATTLENLSKCFHNHNVEIMLTLRSPLDFCFSYYVEAYRWHYFNQKSMDTYEKFFNQIMCNERSQEFTLLFYKRFLRTIESSFQNINIFLFEDLQFDSTGFAKQLSELIDMPQIEVQSLLKMPHENIGITTKNSRQGKSPTLGETISYLQRKLSQRFKFIRYLKKIKILHQLYSNIILKLGSFKIKDDIKHKDLNDQQKEVLFCLISDLDSSFCQKYKLSYEKLKKYKYLK